MLNKRLLIKNLLAHNSENSFFDKKLKIDISNKEGKAKFLKHICALSNSNPNNNAYIIIGVSDETNQILGVDFFDDSKIQNLINAYLVHPPKVSYENIPFPHLPERKVVGLVSIRPKTETSICALRKNIWKYWGGTVFMREGSISKPKVFDIEIKDFNSKLVNEIESHSQNNIKLTLDGVFDFIEKSKDYNPQYQVFKEYFVVCWAGKIKQINGKELLSRVNIELINEQVKLFYSDLDKVEIQYDDHKFEILEYIHLGLEQKFAYYPLEKVSIKFQNTMKYEIETELIFKPPKYDAASLRHFLNHNKTLLQKVSKHIKLTPNELADLEQAPSIYLIAYLNGFKTALEALYNAKFLLKKTYPTAHQRVKDNLRVLRKIKYN